METVSITYEQQRLEYFKQRKEICEKKLEWYRSRKTVGHVDEMMRHEKCSEYGQKIAFYDDAIKAFGGECNA